MPPTPPPPWDPPGCALWGISPIEEGQQHLPSWGDPWDGWVGTPFLGNLSLDGLPMPQGSMTPH